MVREPLAAAVEAPAAKARAATVAAEAALRTWSRRLKRRSVRSVALPIRCHILVDQVQRVAEGFGPLGAHYD